MASVRIGLQRDRHPAGPKPQGAASVRESGPVPRRGTRQKKNRSSRRLEREDREPLPTYLDGVKAQASRCRLSGFSQMSAVGVRSGHPPADKAGRIGPKKANSAVGHPFRVLILVATIWSLEG